MQPDGISEVFVPTYSYACTECADRFDVVQAFTDDALTTCEKCSGRLRKLFNSVGVVFKGSGFYRTDSRADGKKSKSPAAPSGDTSSNSGSSDKAEKTGSSGNGSGDKSGSSEKSTGSTTPATAAASS
jgi:putative FmdB family regulatory protein